MVKSRRTPIRIHPGFLRKNGRTEFVVLTYDEFLAIQERLQDAEDLMSLRHAAAADNGGPGSTLADVKRRVGLSRSATRKAKRRST